MTHVLASMAKSQNGPRRGEVNPESCLEVILELNHRRNAFRLREKPSQTRKEKEKEKMRLVYRRVTVCSLPRCALKAKPLHQQLVGSLEVPYLLESVIEPDSMGSVCARMHTHTHTPPHFI